MNLLKLLIPTSKKQEVTEVESFTIDWKVRADIFKEWYKYHKVFVNKDEAKEFEKQLKMSAEFIGAEITTKFKRN